ncbi:GNAT family N-acetyltransferase [Bacillus sp. SCS-153A]|uniref:GNAT family N-acetyltransferase n=1 Tax=Rossellomorea sedimentorum TaxID=3115294 RepID=UPI00390586F3
MIFPVLETDRLLLRKPTPDDANDMMAYLSDQDVVKHMGLLPFQSIKDAMGEVHWYDSIRKEGSGIRWGITLKDDNRMIGSCGFLNMTAKHARAEVGFELNKDFWGRGIAGETLEAVVQYGFEHIQLERIQALIEPANSSSQRLVEAKGFQREGLLRHYEYTNGTFDDLYMYSLLKSDYKIK